MALEHCQNCEHTIGKLERAFVFNNNIVCSECYAKLNKIKGEHSNIRMVKCPYCAEEIQEGSTLCRYCKSNLYPSIPDIVKSRLDTVSKSPKSRAKSKILWWAFGCWSILFILLLLATCQFYVSEAARDRLYGGSGHSCEIAGGFWEFVLMFIWFLGALPLFIAAVVTRKRE